jgi:hypothetical protein
MTGTEKDGAQGSGGGRGTGIEPSPGSQNGIGSSVDSFGIGDGRKLMRRVRGEGRTGDARQAWRPVATGASPSPAPAPSPAHEPPLSPLIAKSPRAIPSDPGGQLGHPRAALPRCEIFQAEPADAPIGSSWRNPGLRDHLVRNWLWYSAPCHQPEMRPANRAPPSRCDLAILSTPRATILTASSGRASLE